MKVKSLSCVWLFATPWTVAYHGSSVHGIFQARVLEWVAISFSRGSSQPRDRTWVSPIVGRHFTIWATREVKPYTEQIINKDLLHNTGNSTQYSVISYTRKSLKRMNICICTTKLLYCKPETNTTLWVNHMPKQINKCVQLKEKKQHSCKNYPWLLNLLAFENLLSYKPFWGRHASVLWYGVLDKHCT